jgi:vacuolar-type H+-ATPase subunit E/Vma4
MEADNRQQALADEILSDANRQAERTVGRATRRAESILKTARSRAEDTKQRAAEAAAKKAERSAATVMADVPYQEQVRILGVKEEVIGRLFADAPDALHALPRDEMLEILVGLSVEAVSLLDGGEFIIEVSAEDAERFGSQLAGRIAAATGKAKGGDVAVTIAASDEAAGGVIVRSASGPKMVDNSFATRLGRCREALRGRIAEMMFGDDSE